MRAQPHFRGMETRTTPVHAGPVHAEFAPQFPTLRLASLAQRADLWPDIARWHREAWCPDASIDAVLATIRARHGAGADVPSGYVAVEIATDTPVGTAELKVHEMDELPAFRYWLGGVYVRSDWRGRGLAGALVEALRLRARALDLGPIVLQTERLDGGLYARAGWQALGLVRRMHDRQTVLLMRTPPG